ncbi:MAG: heme-copper oxidase subunit III [Halobacteria archaeon]
MSTDSHTPDETHHPAPNDIPRDYGEASWWPFIAAVGAMIIYAGAAIYFLSPTMFPHLESNNTEMLQSGSLGLGIFAFGIAFTMFGLLGWTYQTFVEGFWKRGTRTRGSVALKHGMLLFIATDIATFSGGLAYYFFIRFHPTWTIPVDTISIFLWTNTVLLVTSSITFHYGHHELKKGNRKRWHVLLGTTIVLGIGFVLGQVLEYREFLEHDGFGLNNGLFGSAFYPVTGLHGLHVVLGVILLIMVFVRSMKGQFSGDRDTSILTVGYYWHFVDLMWLILVTVLYLGAALGTKYWPPF